MATSAQLEIIRVEQPGVAHAWEEFVQREASATSYHRWGWKQVMERAFGWPTFYLLARQGDQVTGVLPLVWQKSLLFGSFLTSLPFLNGGGIVARDPAVARSLLQAAIRLADELGVQHLELRQRTQPDWDLPTRTHKVALLCELEPDADRRFASLPHKVRTDIRKSMSYGLTAEFGGRELLEAFYGVFSRNMRDLGTPVYSRSFFEQILAAFPQESFICVVRHNGAPIAGSFLTAFRDTVEAGWSASLYAYLHMKPNMFLYWSILAEMGRRGYRWFDFGRSTVGSGTYRFKKQWGTMEQPLYWSYWTRAGEPLPALSPENPRYRLAIRLWQKLPLAVTNCLGPRIVRCLP
ncbi:MAG: FemAB family PEP-CTERM system-associated protein [Acidobacteriia bacterium]|jgi:FemAB-related protein (PEP-CTERM system-associated)|nr:FemAB family PEP-CTERM system-associated protein [Terriglobia bacterium]